MVTIKESDSGELMLLIQAIENELTKGSCTGHAEAIRALVKLFIINIKRSCTGADTEILNPLKTSHKAFMRFRQLIEDNYCRLHTVKDYASLLNVTTKTLTLYVKECSSYSPLEMINYRIILEAKRLLRYSLLSVKEIAFRLGFEDPSYFVKFFKRIVKQSPADYRES